MSRECAFCPETANKSGEHIWSEWMDKLLPGRKTFKGKRQERDINYSSETLNWTANVVCERCNNTWMSDIEKKHAKPAMEPLIVGKTGTPITQSRADSIARFAFKTAVVVDYLHRNRQPFFSRSIRHGFRESHAIPGSTGMWLSAFESRRGGAVKTVYHEGRFPASHRFEIYVCTFSVGHLVFQVVSQRNAPTLRFRSSRHDRFKYLAIGFWPWIPSGVVWPLSEILKTDADFESFATRWRTLSFDSSSI
jgi:hypothetical protein